MLGFSSQMIAVSSVLWVSLAPVMTPGHARENARNVAVDNDFSLEAKRAKELETTAFVNCEAVVHELVTALNTIGVDSFNSGNISLVYVEVELRSTVPKSIPAECIPTLLARLNENSHKLNGGGYSFFFERKIFSFGFSIDKAGNFSGVYAKSK